VKENDPFEVKRKEGRKTILGNGLQKYFVMGGGLNEVRLASYLKWMHDEYAQRNRK